VVGQRAPLREFLFVDDAADALVHLMKTYSSPEIVNLGTGSEVTIAELVEKICRVVGFDGTVLYDASKPDGTPRKLLDVSRMDGLGWRAQTPLREGIERAYRDFLEKYRE
jgi:GDP-L-fucose synthase